MALRWIGATLAIVAGMLLFNPRLRRVAQAPWLQPLKLFHRGWVVFTAHVCQKFCGTATFFILVHVWDCKMKHIDWHVIDIIYHHISDDHRVQICQVRGYTSPQDFLNDRYGTLRLRLLCAVCGVIPMISFLVQLVIGKGMNWKIGFWIKTRISEFTKINISSKSAMFQPCWAKISI